MVAYVDDLLLYAREEFTINSLIESLHHDKIWICKEGSAEDFLGVGISHHMDGDGLTLTQPGLMQSIISAMSLDASYSTAKDTPADTSPLPKDASDKLADPLIHYAGVIGMLLFLSSHIRPDILLAVHQCAR